MINDQKHLLHPPISWGDSWENRDFKTEENRDGFDRLLLSLVDVFHDICRHDEEWNSAVARGSVDYAASDERELFDEYQRWLNHADPLSVILKNGLEAGFSFPQTAAFQKCLEAARGVCTDDAAFFCGDKLTELRDSAIDSYRRGETEELSESAD